MKITSPVLLSNIVLVVDRAIALIYVKLMVFPVVSFKLKDDHRSIVESVSFYLYHLNGLRFSAGNFFWREKVANAFFTTSYKKLSIVDRSFVSPVFMRVPWWRRSKCRHKISDWTKRFHHSNWFATLGRSVFISNDNYKRSLKIMLKTGQLIQILWWGNRSEFIANCFWRRRSEFSNLMIFSR